MDTGNVIPVLQEWAAIYGIKIVAALVIFVVGRWVAQVLKNLTRKIMERAKVEPTLIPFVANLIYMLLITVVIIAALNKLGIQTTSLIAIIGAAGLAIGLALQGSLANFAAGVLILIFRPFKVNDYIEGAGTAGSVEKIEIFTTHLKTPDNREIIIPNAKLTGDNIVNYTAKDIRRMDLVFGVSYGDDLKKVKELLYRVLQEDDRVLKDPAPMVGVLELADSSVNLAVRPWVKTSEYWNVFFDLKEAVKLRFDSDGVSIPFPQHDVHMYETQAPLS